MSGEVDRCTGHCCRNVVTEYTPKKMREMWLTWKSAGSPAGYDIATVYSAWEYLGERNLTGNRETGNYHIWRCKHVTDAGDCAIYATRPKLCAAYPHEHYLPHGCSDPECTWTSKKDDQLFEMREWVAFDV